MKLTPVPEDLFITWSSLEPWIRLHEFTWVQQEIHERHGKWNWFYETLFLSVTKEYSCWLQYKWSVLIFFLRIPYGSSKNNEAKVWPIAWSSKEKSKFPYDASASFFRVNECDKMVIYLGASHCGPHWKKWSRSMEGDVSCFMFHDHIVTLLLHYF